MNPKGSATLSPIQPDLTIKEQAEELRTTVKCRLGQSKVHGVGVITLRDIKKGEQLFCALTVKARWYSITFANLKKLVGELHPEIFQLIMDRWPNVVNGAPFLSPNYDQRLTSFMNHADEANYAAHYDSAIVDIPKGEEVFVDYRTIPNYEKAYPWLSVVE